MSGRAPGRTGHRRVPATAVDRAGPVPAGSAGHRRRAGTRTSPTPSPSRSFAERRGRPVPVPWPLPDEQARARGLAEPVGAPRAMPCQAQAQDRGQLRCGTSGRNMVPSPSEGPIAAAGRPVDVGDPPGPGRTESDPEPSRQRIIPRFRPGQIARFPGSPGGARSVRPKTRRGFSRSTSRASFQRPVDRPPPPADGIVGQGLGQDPAVHVELRQDEFELVGVGVVSQQLRPWAPPGAAPAGRRR